MLGELRAENCALVNSLLGTADVTLAITSNRMPITQFTGE